MTADAATPDPRPMMNAGMYSSATDDWATPQDLFDALDAEFGFTIDVCASDGNAKCICYYTERDDGLAHQWRGIVWMNPPYGRDIGQWIAKAWESSQRNNATVVCLIPARTDTAYWHDYVMKSAEIRLIRGRLRFGDSANSAPFPSAVVVFRPAPKPELTTFIRPADQIASVTP